MKAKLCTAAVLLLSSPSLAQDADGYLTDRTRLPLDQSICDAGCAGTAESDPCLIGNWVAESNGFADWLKANGIPFDITLESPFVLTIYEGGQFRNPPYAFQFAQTVAGMSGSGRGVATEAYGCWSVKDEGIINFCHKDNTPRMTVTVYVNGMTRTMDAPPRSRPDRTHGYECSEDRLTLFFEFSKDRPQAYVDMYRAVPVQ